MNNPKDKMDNPKVDNIGTKRWYENGWLHREDGPAVERANGTKFWYKNGKLHRTDGPTVEDADGYKAWYQNSERHREDGPAVEWPDGDEEWWLNDVRVTEEEVARLQHPKLKQYQSKLNVEYNEELL